MLDIYSNLFNNLYMINMVPDNKCKNEQEETVNTDYDAEEDEEKINL